MVAPGKKKSSAPGKKKSSTRDGETSNSSNPTFEAQPKSVKISESQRAVNEPIVVPPSTGAEQRGNLTLNVKVDPDSLPSLKSRNSGAALFNALRRFNDAQRNAVRDIGFDVLFRLDAPKELPTKLCYWLLNNFDPRTCDIVLNDGNRLHVDAEDVNIVLGLPNGQRTIERRTRVQTNDFVQEFRERFRGPEGDVPLSVTPTKVIESMLNEADGGLWFKRLFLIAMTSNLVESATNGYVSTLTIPNFEDVNIARGLNWVVVLTRDFERTLPTLESWTVQRLRKRKKKELDHGGFGNGHVSERYVVINLEEEEPIEAPDVYAAPNIGAAQSSRAVPDAAKNVDASEFPELSQSGMDCNNFGISFLRQAKLVAEAVKGIVSMVQTAPLNMFENTQFQRVVEITEQLLGCKIARPTVDLMPDNDNVCNTQADDAYWSHPEVEAYVSSILNTMPKREDIQSADNDYPDYGLGLTQDLQQIGATKREKTSNLTKATVPAKQVASVGGPKDTNAGVQTSKKDKVVDADSDVGKSSEHTVSPPQYESFYEMALRQLAARKVAKSHEVATISGDKQQCEEARKGKNVVVPDEKVTDEQAAGVGGVEKLNPGIEKALNVTVIGAKAQQRKRSKRMPETVDDFSAGVGNFYEDARKRIAAKKAAEGGAEDGAEKTLVKKPRSNRAVKSKTSKPLSTEKGTEKSTEDEGKSAEDPLENSAPAPTACLVKAIDKGKQPIAAADAKIGGGIQHKLDIVLRPKLGCEVDTLGKRKRSDPKKTEAEKSPYQQRAIDASHIIDKMDRALCYWVMNNKEIEKTHVVFATNDCSIMRDNMLSMANERYIDACIIDVWSKILNKAESKRAPSSPYRFFASTQTTSLCIVNLPEDLTKEQGDQQFYDNLKSEIDPANGVDFEKIELFFFPIIQSDHFYVICINMKWKRVEIIDNSDALDNDPIEAKYQHVPATLVELFLKFLVSNGLKHKAAWKKINYIRLAMPWRDDTNKVDCGVFAMRHMETYMGETVRSWRCGLAKDKPKMLKYMRVKYCAAILGSDINILRDQVLAASKEYYELKSKAEVVGVDELLTVYE
ncbi:hypothetical protein CASFOL_034017 [Castilleja foliolosa]|uniref:Ubiquitin-like protease family profile domain-containing protein n=1 Tax=Castilleja foliolosa TaxID=1961234 RepID=A0ABD3BZS0_9LAMI